MKKTTYYFSVVLIPLVIMYVYNSYLLLVEGILFSRSLSISNTQLILAIIFFIISAVALIYLAVSSLRFSKSKDFYILLSILSIFYLFSSISIIFFPQIISADLLSQPLILYIIKDAPWYVGYYGSLLILNYLYTKNNLKLEIL